MTTWLVVALVGCILAFLAVYVPIPIFYEFLPGPVEDVQSLVTVEGRKTYSSEGPMYLTTASLDPQVTFFDVFAAVVTPHRDIVYAEAIAPGGDLRELQRLTRLDMELSKANATQVALAEIRGTETRCDQARVTQIVPGSPAESAFRVGDLVRTVDGRQVKGSDEVVAAVRAHEIGDEVRFSVERDGATRDLRVRTMAAPSDPGVAAVGIVMEDVNLDIEPGVSVEIDTGDIGGPSAGLMFALTIYDRLTPGDLTKGRALAGTGTIECDGTVGEIGEPQLKVVGAERGGADVFFVPTGNAPVARGAAGDIEVVAVADFGDALDFLERLD